ncbi:MAG TPA: hypothetical protein VIY56_06835 [Vicinamibacterales bacterium]
MGLRKSGATFFQRGLVVLAVLAPLAVSTGAHAQASQPDATGGGDKERIAALTWSRSRAASSCVGEAAIVRGVEQKLGRAVFAPASGASLLIDGLAERDQAHGVWRATLSLSSAGGAALGQRELSISAPGCGPLGEMVVLAIALMIRDRDTLAAGDAKEPSLEAAAAPPEGRAWESSTDVGGTLSAGLLPNPAAGVRLRGVFRPAQFPVFEIEALAAFPGEAQFMPQVGTRFLATWLAAAVCPFERSTQPWRARVCAGGSIGVLFFRSFGTNVTGPRRRPSLLVRVGAALERDIGRSWFAVVGAELLVPAIRERFEVEDDVRAHTLFEMTPVCIAGGLGVGRRF